MRPRTSSMLQQNNNNNYPCLGMSGSTREMLQKCSRVALPFPGRLELGDLPLIRGLRAWALCSKNRRKPGGGGQAPLAPPPQKSSSSCPRPADVYLSGEWGSMGYGLPLGLDARQSGIGALVTVATLKTSEGNGKTQTQCLFLRTEKGSCLYSTAKPSSGGTASAVGGWLRGKTGGSKEAGRRDPGVQVQTGATRVRVRSGRRWRKSCNSAGREKAGLSRERRRGEDPAGGRQEGTDKGRREQEGASRPSSCEAEAESQREEGQREGTLTSVVSTEDFEKNEDMSPPASSRLLTPHHDVYSLPACHPEDEQKTQTVDDPNSDVMNAQAGDVIESPPEDNREPEEQQSDDVPGDVLGVSASICTSTRTSGCGEEVEEQEREDSSLPLSNCQMSQIEDFEVTKHLMEPPSGHDPEPEEGLDQCCCSRLRNNVGSSRGEIPASPTRSLKGEGESQGPGLLVSNLDLHRFLPDVSQESQTVDSGIIEPRAGDLNIPLDKQMPKKEQEDKSSVSYVSPSPAGGSTCLLESDTYLWLQEEDLDLQQEPEGWDTVSDLNEEKKSEFLLQDEERRRRQEDQDGVKGQKIFRDDCRHCGEAEGGSAELEEEHGETRADDDETCQPEEEEDDAQEEEEEEERSRGETRGTCRGKFLSKERGTNVADLLTHTNPALLGVMATSPPRLEQEEEEEKSGGVSKTSQGAREESERNSGELENPEEKLGEEDGEEEEEEDEFGLFMQAEGESVWSPPEADPAPPVVDDSSRWTPDWTQSLADDSWTAFPPMAEGCGEASGAAQWWPAEERKGRSQNLASLFTEAFPSLPSSPSDLDPVPTLTQILRCGAGEHKRLLDSFHDLNKMIVQRNKRASGASRDLLLTTLHLETPRPDSRPAPWPANRRPSPGLSSATRHTQTVAAKRRLSYDYNRHGAE